MKCPIVEIKKSGDRAFFDLLWLNPSRQLNLETRHDRTGWASRYTLLTDNAPRSGKNQHRRFGVQGQRLGGTDARTESAVNAKVFVDGNFAASKGDVDILGAHPFYGGIKGIDIARKFHHQLPDLVGGNLGADDIGCNVEILSQSVGDGHLDIAAGEGQGDSFFHGILIAIVLRQFSRQ